MTEVLDGTTCKSGTVDMDVMGRGIGGNQCLTGCAARGWTAWPAAWLELVLPRPISPHWPGLVRTKLGVVCGIRGRKGEEVTPRQASSSADGCNVDPSDRSYRERPRVGLGNGRRGGAAESRADCLNTRPAKQRIPARPRQISRQTVAGCWSDQEFPGDEAAALMGGGARGRGKRLPAVCVRDRDAATGRASPLAEHEGERELAAGRASKAARFWWIGTGEVGVEDWIEVDEVALASNITCRVLCRAVVCLHQVGRETTKRARQS